MEVARNFDQKFEYFIRVLKKNTNFIEIFNKGAQTVKMHWELSNLGLAFTLDCTLQKMCHGFSHVFLTTVWSKMRPSPMEIPSFSLHMPWKFFNLDSSKIHVMFEHGEPIKPGQMTWNSHGISCPFWPNCRRFVK